MTMICKICDILESIITRANQSTIKFFKNIFAKIKPAPTFKNLNELATEIYLKNAGTEYVKWLNTSFPGEEINHIAYQLMAKDEVYAWGNIRTWHTVYGKITKDFNESDFIEIDVRSVDYQATRAKCHNRTYFLISLDAKDVKEAVKKVQAVIDSF